jgi:hypothetical protein
VDIGRIVGVGRVWLGRGLREGKGGMKEGEGGRLMGTLRKKRLRKKREGLGEVGRKDE